MKTAHIHIYTDKVVVHHEDDTRPPLETFTTSYPFFLSCHLSILISEGYNPIMHTYNHPYKPSYSHRAKH